MEIELMPVVHSGVEPHRLSLANLFSNTLNQRHHLDSIEMRRQSIKTNHSLKARGWLYEHIQSHKVHAIALVLFISLSIIAGVLTVCLTAPKANNNCQRNFKRMMKSSLVSSSQPRSMVLGDLNHDQQIDIIVANSGTDTIGIFISKGSGTFTDQQTYSTGLGSRPYSVTTNDFNNDSYLDIAVANYGTNNIGIFFGKGNGTFNDRKVFSFGSSRPLFLSTGDFNEDNRIDIIVINYGTNNIGILLGYGNGSFQSQMTYSTGYDSFPTSLAVGDFNKDNHLDIAVANYGTDNIGIFLGYGNGTFVSQQTYTTLLGSNPSSIAIGDLNNDDKLDIVVANNGTGNVSIFFGHGNGSFRTQTMCSIDSKSYPQYITVGDLNKDNTFDIVVVDSQRNQVHILRGCGNESFETISTYDALFGSHPFYVVIADFNNNNQSDIAVVNYGTNSVSVLIDYSVKPSARQTNYDINSLTGAVSVAISDFNSDHIFDVVYATYDYINVRNGLGDGNFGNEIQYSIPNRNGPQYLCVGDLNNDTKMDIVVANKFSNDIGVLLGYGNSSFATMISYSTGIDSEPWWVALGDVNNDHQLDIVSANTGSNTIGIFLGNGDGTFDTLMAYSTGDGSRPYSVAVGDLNNDNYLDLAAVNANNYVVIFRGYGNGSFIIWNVLHTLQGAHSVAISLANLNSDNYLDIVVTNPITDNIGVFLGHGNATFGTQTLYSTGYTSSPYYVIVADFNNDNISDIATTNYGSDEVVIFNGKRNGSFELDRRYSTEYGSKPYGIAVADLDNDKRLDIVIALSGNKNIAVLTEYQAASFSNQTKYLTGSAPQPLSVTIGDLNNDNRSDIVVSNSGTGNLGILLALENATFSMNTKYQIGTDSYPQYVITDDVNQDDQLDIISVNSKTDSISVIIGHGNGTFAEQLIYSTGNDSRPIAVAIGDFNNDARLDLVIANEGTDNVGIFFGYNYTVFQNQKIYTSNDSLAPTSIGVSDFNNDNHLDIATTFYDSDNIGILLGDGNGNFTIMITYSTGNGSKPYGIAVDDLNNDNRSDIAVAIYATNNIGIFLGYGNGSFATMMTYSAGESSGPLSVIIADLNNDSYSDIVVANFRPDSVGILLGYGNGSFSVVKTYSTGEDSSILSVTVGDFNNDHYLDIAVANIDTHNIGILFGYGDGTFGNPLILQMTLSSLPMYLTVGDFNKDSRLDIAVADRNSHKVGIFIGYGDGNFAAMQTYSTGVGSTPRYVSVGDFNNDNKSDIAVVNEGTNSVVVLFGLGDGSFLLGTPHSTGIDSQPYALAIGDFNNDSRLDIAVGNTYTNNIGIFLAYSSRPFGSMDLLIMEDGSKPHLIVVSDLNNDAIDDIIIVNSGSDNLGISFGHGDGSFSDTIHYSTGNGSAPSSVAIANFNNDTYLDIVVTNSHIDNIAVFLGTGNGTFVNRTNYSTGVRSHPYTVITGDFNNDNVSDIVVTNFGTSNILLIYGRGDGTFENETLYPLGYDYRPYSIAVKDLNQDNWLDIVITCYGTDHVETLTQMCL